MIFEELFPIIQLIHFKLFLVLIGFKTKHTLYRQAF